MFICLIGPNGYFWLNASFVHCAHVIFQYKKEKKIVTIFYLDKKKTKRKGNTKCIIKINSKSGINNYHWAKQIRKFISFEHVTLVISIQRNNADRFSYIFQFECFFFLPFLFRKINKSGSKIFTECRGLLCMHSFLVFGKWNCILSYSANAIITN